MNKAGSILWGLLGALSGALAGCGDGAPAATPAAGASAPEPAPAGPAQSARTPWLPVKDALGAPLYVAPAQVLAAPGALAEVMPPFRAQVVAVAVAPGQQVAAGEAVATVLMPDVLRAAGAHAGAGLRLAAYTARRDQLTALKGEGLLRAGDLAETEARIAESRAAQIEALSVLRAAGLGAADAAGLTTGGGRTVLRSPVAGVVTQVEARLGQVWEAGAPPLLRVAGRGPLRIEARLGHALPAGARFALSVPGGPAALPLRLVARAPQADGRDGTVATWLVPTDEDPPALPVGLSAAVQVYLGAPAAGPGPGPASASARPVRIAARALRLSGGRATVVKRRGDAGTEIPVQVLATPGSEAVVTGALAPGDEVAADPGLAEGGAS